MRQIWLLMLFFNAVSAGLGACSLSHPRPSAFIPVLRICKHKPLDSRYSFTLWSVLRLMRLTWLSKLTHTSFTVADMPKEVWDPEFCCTILQPFMQADTDTFPDTQPISLLG